MDGFKIAFISCVSTKLIGTHKAKDIYISDLFKKSYKFCCQNYDCIYILSAKYGLLFPDDVIQDYDLTLNTFTKQQKIEWAENVYIKAQKVINANDIIYWHCGINYRCFLESKFLNIQHTPLKNLGIGKQLQWYSIQLKSNFKTNLF